jgi:hypothetical protein
MARSKFISAVKNGSLYEITYQDPKTGKTWVAYTTEQQYKIRLAEDRLIASGAKEIDVEELRSLSYSEGSDDGYISGANDYGAEID